MIINRAGDIAVQCDLGCGTEKVLVPYGMSTTRSARSLAAGAGWVHAFGKDHCPACVTAARSYRELQFDRFGPYEAGPMEPIVSIPNDRMGDETDARMQIMFMVADAHRAERVRSAFLVLYSRSPWVAMHHRSIALGIIDGTGDPLIDKGSV